jgi:hypothetical protein
VFTWLWWSSWKRKKRMAAQNTVLLRQLHASTACMIDTHHRHLCLQQGITDTNSVQPKTNRKRLTEPFAVDSVMELFLPVASLPLTTSVTLLRSTMPLGLVDATTFWSAKRNRKPCFSTNQRRRQVRRCSPCDCNQPDFSALCQNSTSS